MLRLYRFFFLTGLVLLSPYFLYQSLRRGKYREGLKQRFGLNLPILEARHPRLWIHAVSVGEVLLIEPLIRRLAESYRSLHLIISTTTTTGQRLAKSMFGQGSTVIYFPLDLASCVRRSWKRMQPDSVILVETEIWPTFIEETSRSEVPIFVVNGRVSDRSFPRYLLVRRWIGRVLNKLTLVMAQSDQDAERFRKLGCAPDRVMVAGNMKYDAQSLPSGASPSLGWMASMKQLWRGPVWIAGSTMPAEEEVILEVFEALRCETDLAGLRLILAPRHPERFDDVAELLHRLKITFKRRTDLDGCADAADVAVILLDTLGELASLYAVADLAFVGGSLVPRGGHNILEAARFGKPIVVGPYMENFRSMVEEFRSAGALEQLSRHDRRGQVEELKEAAGSILRDPAKRQRMGSHAQLCAEQNRGSLDRVLQLLAPRIENLIHQERAGRGPGPARHFS